MNEIKDKPLQMIFTKYFKYKRTYSLKIQYKMAEYPSIL